MLTDEHVATLLNQLVDLPGSEACQLEQAYAHDVGAAYVAGQLHGTAAALAAMREEALAANSATAILAATRRTNFWRSLLLRSQFTLPANTQAAYRAVAISIGDESLADDPAVAGDPADEKTPA